MDSSRRNSAIYLDFSKRYEGLQTARKESSKSLLGVVEELKALLISSKPELSVQEKFNEGFARLASVFRAFSDYCEEMITGFFTLCVDGSLKHLLAPSHLRVHKNVTSRPSTQTEPETPAKPSLSISEERAAAQSERKTPLTHPHDFQPTQTERMEELKKKEEAKLKELEGLFHEKVKAILGEFKDRESLLTEKHKAKKHTLKSKLRESKRLLQAANEELLGLRAQLDDSAAQAKRAESETKQLLSLLAEQEDKCKALKVQKRILKEQLAHKDFKSQASPDLCVLDDQQPTRHRH